MQSVQAGEQDSRCNVKATIRDTLDREFLSREEVGAILAEKGYTLLESASPVREQYSLNVEVDSIGHWSIVPEVVFVRLVKDGAVSRPVFLDSVQANPIFRGVNKRRAMRLLGKLPPCIMPQKAATISPGTTLNFQQTVQVSAEPSAAIFVSGKIYNRLSEVPAGAPACIIHGAYDENTGERLTRTIRAGSEFWIINARAGHIDGDASKPAVQYALHIFNFGCSNTIEEAARNVLTNGATCPSIVPDVARFSYGLIMTCFATKSGPLMDADVSRALEGIARIERERF